MAHDAVAEAIGRGDYGAALRLTRNRRGLSQEELGRLCGCDRSMVSRLETGKVCFTVDLLRLFATALTVPLRTFGLSDPGETAYQRSPQRQGGDEMRRRAFFLAAGAAALTAGQTSAVAAALAPSPAALLHKRLEQMLFVPKSEGLVRPGDLTSLLGNARRDYRSARYFDLASRLTTATASAESAVADDPSAENQALLTASYNAVTRALFKLPASGLEWVSTDRALRAARKADNPLLLAETTRMLAVAHRRSSSYEAALGVFTRVADDLAVGGHHLKGTIAIETLCSAAYAAAKNGDREYSLELIREAAILARHVNNDRQHWTAVDPATNIHVYRVSIGTALHDPGIAFGAIKAVALESLPTTERKARFLVDAAAARLAANQLDAAARTLLLASRVAPQEVPSRATARAVAATIRKAQPNMSAALAAVGL